MFARAILLIVMVMMPAAGEAQMAGAPLVLEAIATVTVASRDIGSGGALQDRRRSTT